MQQGYIKININNNGRSQQKPRQNNKLYFARPISTENLRFFDVFKGTKREHWEMLLDWFFLHWQQITDQQYLILTMLPST